MPPARSTRSSPASSQHRLSRLRTSIVRLKGQRNAVAASFGLEEAIARLRELQAATIEAKILPLARRLAKAYSAGIPSPTLSICGRGTQEIRFTRYLAYFLDPLRPHGLGTAFLRAVLDGYVLDDQLLETALDCRVVSELSLGDVPYGTRRIGSYCDIGIVAPRLLVLIEQKVLSGQSNYPEVGATQLQKYDRAISESPLRHGRDVVRILLTPSGHTPDDSGWLPMSHAQLVNKAAILLSQSSIPLVARENLRRLLIDLAIGPYERDENEVLELVRAAGTVAAGNGPVSEIRRFLRLVVTSRPLVAVLQGGLET